LNAEVLFAVIDVPSSPPKSSTSRIDAIG